MTRGKYVSYLRVSTDKQGRSGLGLEAQREAVNRYLNGGTWTLAAEYVETESGRRSDRPKLAAALAYAKAIGATVVFAKLDRLTRNVDLLRSLVASGVDLIFCDLPQRPTRSYGSFSVDADGVCRRTGGRANQRAYKSRLGRSQGARSEAGQSQRRSRPSWQADGQPRSRGSHQGEGQRPGRPTQRR